MQRHSTRALAAITFAVLAISLAGLPAELGRVGAFVAELSSLVLGVTLALSAARPWLGAASTRTALRLATAMLVAMSLGQIARSKKLFPLVPFTMYARAAEGEAVFYEYQAQCRSGARARFRPSRTIATLGRARIVRGLAREIDAIADMEAHGRNATAKRALLRDTVRALIAAGDHDARDPIVHVEVVRVVLPPPYHPPAARRRTFAIIAATSTP